jgi:hypothetical protein
MTLEKKPLAAVQPAAAGAGQVFGARSPDRVVTRAPKGGSSGAVWFFAAGGTALVAAGAGGLWLFQNKELTSCHNPPAGQRCNNESAVLGRRNLAAGATLATGAAAVTLAVIGFLSRDSSPSDPSARSALSCAVLPSGFFCTRPF